MSNEVKFGISAIVILMLLVVAIGVSAGKKKKNDCPGQVAIASAILHQPLEYEAGFDRCVVRVDVNGVALWIDPQHIINGVKP